MSIIRILPDEVSNRIAAGEVVERPASVVKELLENAIDAGAKRIKILIENAGLNRISIIDDGSGMDTDDALMCFEPHGTSKIRTESDLLRIASYGFRGEAVPSIASVAQLTLRTRTESAESGFEVQNNGGKIVHAAPIGCAKGTEFIVRNLFYNVPARRRFLRTNATEEKHIYEAVLNMALPHPELDLELFMDGRRVLRALRTPDSLKRMQTFFGESFARDFMPIQAETPDARIRGFIARHGVVRSSRREQRFFINGRAIEALALFNGVRDGYGALVEKNTYPPVVLLLEMDPGLIDVNVHPAKREIRFRQERSMSFHLAAAIADALKTQAAPTVAIANTLPLKMLLKNSEIAYTPVQAIEQRALDLGRGLPVETAHLRDTEFPSVPVHLRTAESEPETDVSTQNSETVYSAPAPVVVNLPPPPSPDPRPVFPADQLRVLGALDETYLIAVYNEALVLIDQHAAHERILFERFLARLKAHDGENSAAQMLLFPISIELNVMEINLLRRYSALFAPLGFDFAPAGPTTILLNAVPTELPRENWIEHFHFLLAQLEENDALKSKQISREAIAAAACKAAVKAHDALTPDEAQGLLRQLAECDHPFSCPHGRPTLLQISRAEIERRFNRK